MGVTQILMVVLGIIVVGAAVSVSIAMFDRQSDAQSRAHISTDLMYFGSQIQTFCRIPKSMKDIASGSLNIGDVVQFIHHDISYPSAGVASFRNSNAEYFFTYEVGPGNGNPDGSDWEVEIRGVSFSRSNLEIIANVKICGGPAPHYGIEVH